MRRIARPIEPSGSRIAFVKVDSGDKAESRPDPGLHSTTRHWDSRDFAKKPRPDSREFFASFFSLSLFLLFLIVISSDTGGSFRFWKVASASTEGVFLFFFREERDLLFTIRSRMVNESSNRSFNWFNKYQLKTKWRVVQRRNRYKQWYNTACLHKPIPRTFHEWLNRST